MLDTADSPAAIRFAVEELGAVVEKQITDSFGDSLYGRAIEEMRVMREEMVEVEEVGVWNQWLKGVKERLVRGELGGERRDFWWEIRRERLGLVVGGGGVGEEEAKEVSLAHTGCVCKGKMLTVGYSSCHSSCSNVDWELLRFSDQIEQDINATNEVGED